MVAQLYVRHDQWHGNHRWGGVAVVASAQASRELLAQLPSKSGRVRKVSTV
jgi:hypothetical protein